MPENMGYLNDYEPKTNKGKKLVGIFDRLERREKIYLREMRSKEDREDLELAKRRLGIIRPEPMGKRFRSFMKAKIRFR